MCICRRYLDEWVYSTVTIYFLSNEILENATCESCVSRMSEKPRGLRVKSRVNWIRFAFLWSTLLRNYLARNVPVISAFNLWLECRYLLQFISTLIVCVHQIIIKKMIIPLRLSFYWHPSRSVHFFTFFFFVCISADLP